MDLIHPRNYSRRALALGLTHSQIRAQRPTSNLSHSSIFTLLTTYVIPRIMTLTGANPIRGYERIIGASLIVEPFGSSFYLDSEWWSIASPPQKKDRTSLS